MLLEAFIFNIHRSCTPARVRYTMKGTRKIRVPLRVPLSCTLQRNVERRKRLVSKDLEVRVPLPYGLKNLPVWQDKLFERSNYEQFG